MNMLHMPIENSESNPNTHHTTACSMSISDNRCENSKIAKNFVKP